MGAFSKIADIISSNINAILDKAEDPIKISRLMVQEIEDTIIDTKSSLALTLADQKKSQRQIEECRLQCDDYQAKAEMALSKGKEDLAKKILEQIMHLEEKMAHYIQREQELDSKILVEKNNIASLDTKLQELKFKLDKMTQELKDQGEPKVSNSDASPLAADKLDKLESQLEKLGAKTGAGKHGSSELDREIAEMEKESFIEKRLAELRKKVEPSQK
jgi:phage shock protein A